VSIHPNTAIPIYYFNIFTYQLVIILAHFLNRPNCNSITLKSLWRMKKEKKTHNYSVTGLIIASDWDIDGNIADVAVYGDDEEIYLVKKRGSIQNLIEAVQKRVKIEGQITTTTNGSKCIDVQSIQFK